jgi:hypothetical protein
MIAIGRTSYSSLIAVLILLAWASMNACTHNNVDEDIDIVTTGASPNNKYLATAYNVSGGGGAGHIYNLVNLRKQGEPFESKQGVIFVASGTHKITPVWQDDEHLIIKHSKASGIYTKAGEWGSDNKVLIRYVEEE